MEFKNSGEQGNAAGIGLRLDVDAATSVNFAMQQNDVPVVRSIRIENGGDQGLHDVRVRLSASRPIFTPVELRLDVLPPGDTHRFEPVDLVLDPGLLCNQGEREQLQLAIEVVRGTEVVARATRPLEVLAFNEWRGAEGLAELIAAFVTPNHPSVEGMLIQIGEVLKRMTGDPGIGGYQSSMDRVRLTVQAACAAFRAREIGYTNPPASFELTGQKVRSIDQVLDGRLGTCLDLVVALASILEQAGLNPLVILVRGHAILGVWLKDERFPQTLIDDRSRLLKRIQLGEILVVETTSLVAGSAVDFQGVQEQAMRRLDPHGDFVCAVDIAACRRERIRPLPSRAFTGTGFEVVTPQAMPNAAEVLLAVRESAIGERASRRAKAIERDDDLDGITPDAAERLDRWKRRLLDLTLRNRLLNYRVTKRAVPLFIPDIASFEDLLADGRDFAIQSKAEALQGARDLTAEARRTGTDSEGEILTALMREGRVCTPFAPNDLAGRLLGIYREARTSIEESGSNTLYVALGSLVWYESESSQSAHIAPLVLVPVALTRDVSRQTFRIERADDEPRVNITLLEMLRTNFGIDGGHLERLGQDDSGYDIREVLRGFVSLIKDVPRWEVREDANLALFSFAKFVMWADLETRRKQIASNKVVRRLLERSSSVALSEIEAVEDPDRLTESGGLVPAVDADSSQLSAVHAAARGRTFVLQGPPGTGKSQTITNIVASAIASGKRVLFVAEKMAALGVVKGRLNRLGLGHFCLEIHSSKAGKKEVLAQLQEALDATNAVEPREWGERVRNLEEARAELNQYADAMHQERVSGESVYTVVGRRSRLESAPRVEIPMGDPLGITRERLATFRASVARIASAASHVGNVASHPLRGVTQSQWTPALGDAIATGSTRLAAAIRTLASATDPFVELLGPSCEGTRSAAALASWRELRWLADLARHVHLATAPTEALVRQPNWSTMRSQLLEEIAAGRARDAHLRSLRLHYRDTLLATDVASALTRARAAASSGWLMRWFKMRGVRRLLAGHAITLGRSNAQIVADLEVANATLAANAAMLAPGSIGSSLMGQGWGIEGRWEEFARLIEWAHRARAILADQPPARGLSPACADGAARLMSVDRDQLAQGAPLRRALDAFTDAMEAFDDALSALNASAAVNREDVAHDDQPGFIPAMQDAATRWSTAIDVLPDWCAWCHEARVEGVPELRPLVSAIATGEIAPSRASDVFERAFASSWLGAVFAIDASLRRFTHTRHTSILETFRDCDLAAISLGAAVVRARGRQGAPVSGFSQANPESELGVLKRQLSLQRRHMPVRKLVERLPNLLPRLKPCWLMSPMSVAQYLDPKLPPFDLVVFDEASQIPAWDAIGAIARGAEAIIVGDSKQLPPTTFFASQDSDDTDDESEFDELESILEESVAANVPSLSLRWHYRSRHESLIAFSNYHYYANGLLTFPSSDLARPGLGVSLVYFASGRYDKGGARTNRVEAEAVVAEVVKRLTEAGTGQASIGVVTFSVAQQYLIEDLLDVERRNNPAIERFFGAAMEEPVFIKNLENVQGDERDTILFSVCYGPHNDGPPSMNFGPINRQGGERRLNVAITRARREVVVYTSMRPDQIDLSRTRAVGAAHLRSFLDYAERGPRAILEAATPGTRTESPFEEEVYAALSSRGHLLDVQVGCSGYRIDLAIKDPERPGRYLLGIECDGATYHSAKSARDRDRLREQVLRGLGWRIHRVWSTDWLQSRDSAINRIEKAIADAMANRDSVNPPLASLPTHAHRTQPLFASAPPSGTTPATASAAQVHTPLDLTLPGQSAYTSAKLSRAGRDPEALRDGSASRDVLRDIIALVETESPIHRERIVSRVAEAWHIERLTPRTRDAIDAVIDAAMRTNRVVPDGDFLWSSQGTTHLGARFRVSSSDDADARGIDHIHPLEIANAARAVLAQQFSMPFAALCSEVARVFGILRVTSKVEAAVREGVARLEQSGGCRITGDVVSA